jgi:hypothetical protein
MTNPAAPAADRRLPATIVVAAALLAIEALSALVFAVLEVGQIRVSRAGVGVGVTILMGGFGLLLLFIARGVFLGRRWSRGPAVATQLILLPLAWSFVGGSTTWVAVVLAVMTIAALVGLLHPRSTAVFTGSPADKTPS